MYNLEVHLNVCVQFFFIWVLIIIVKNVIYVITFKFGLLLIVTL